MVLIVVSIILIVIITIVVVIAVRVSRKDKKEKQVVDYTQYVSFDNPILAKFSNEKFKDLYVYSYKDFLLLMVDRLKATGNPEYKTFNYPISEWVSNHSIDSINDMPGWFRWIEMFERDNDVFLLNIPAVFVRNFADAKVRSFVKELKSAGKLYKDDEVEKLSESIFIKASIDNFVFLHNPDLK